MILILRIIITFTAVIGMIGCWIYGAVILTNTKKNKEEEKMFGIYFLIMIVFGIISFIFVLNDKHNFLTF